jgi:hypothetical protein
LGNTREVVEEFGLNEAREEQEAAPRRGGTGLRAFRPTLIFRRVLFLGKRHASRLTISLPPSVFASVLFTTSFLLASWQFEVAELQYHTRAVPLDTQSGQFHVYPRASKYSASSDDSDSDFVNLPKRQVPPRVNLALQFSLCRDTQIEDWEVLRFPILDDLIRFWMSKAGRSLPLFLHFRPPRSWVCNRMFIGIVIDIYVYLYKFVVNAWEQASDC